MFLKHCTWRFAYDEALLAQLKVIPDLKQMTIDAQENDVKLQQRVQLIRNGNKTDYFIKGDGGLYYNNKLCVRNVHELKKKLMYETTILYSPCIL